MDNVKFSPHGLIDNLELQVGQSRLLLCLFLPFSYYNFNNAN